MPFYALSFHEVASLFTPCNVTDNLKVIIFASVKIKL